MLACPYSSSSTGIRPCESRRRFESVGCRGGPLWRSPFRRERRHHEASHYLSRPSFVIAETQGPGWHTSLVFDNFNLNRPRPFLKQNHPSRLEPLSPRVLFSKSLSLSARADRPRPPYIGFHRSKSSFHEGRWSGSVRASITLAARRRRRSPRRSIRERRDCARAPGAKFFTVSMMILDPRENPT